METYYVSCNKILQTKIQVSEKLKKIDYDAAYSDSKDLAKRTISDKVLREKAYEIARNPKYDVYQKALASMVYTFFNKRQDQE